MAKKAKKRRKAATKKPTPPADWRGRLQWLAVAVVIGGSLAWYAWPTPTVVDVVVPDLSAPALKGQVAFNENCGACHGENGGGSDQGPPLVHDTYQPGHHGDRAFLLAMRRGVRQHHWPFGNMPPQPQISERQATDIVRFIREIQQANGIVYRRHRM